MNELQEFFLERKAEIESYLALVYAVEKQLQSGTPHIGKFIISTQQQKILYSNVYLQLYSLIESTVTTCINRVTKSIITNRVSPDMLSTKLQREWVRFTASTHEDLGYEKRLEKAMDLFSLLEKSAPVSSFLLEKGGGGNWDNQSIHKYTRERLGLDLNLSEGTRRDINKKLRDDQTALMLVKQLRNKLSHGNISFEECGEGVTYRDLENLTSIVFKYMEEVVLSFTNFIESEKFLNQDLL